MLPRSVGLLFYVAIVLCDIEMQSASVPFEFKRSRSFSDLARKRVNYFKVLSLTNYPVHKTLKSQGSWEQSGPNGPLVSIPYI